MEAFGDMVDQLVRHSKTKELNTAQMRTDFRRSCSDHFYGAVFPEMQRFKAHLREQGICIAVEPLCPLDKNVIRAALVIQYPENQEHTLEIRYDFPRQDLAFLRFIGGRHQPSADKRYPCDLLHRISCVKAYDLIETFVSAVLGELVE